MKKLKLTTTSDVLDHMENTLVRGIYGERKTAITQKWGKYWMVANRATNPRKSHAQYRWFYDEEGNRVCSVGQKLGKDRSDWYNSDSVNTYYIQKSRKDFKEIRNFIVSIDPEAEIKIY